MAIIFDISADTEELLTRLCEVGVRHPMGADSALLAGGVLRFRFQIRNGVPTVRLERTGDRQWVYDQDPSQTYDDSLLM